MPSPLAILNPTAAYSEIVRQQQTIRKVHVHSHKGVDDSNMATPSIPPRTPESKVILPVLDTQLAEAAVASVPPKPKRSDATLRKESQASAWEDNMLYDSVVSGSDDSRPVWFVTSISLSSIMQIKN